MQLPCSPKHVWVKEKVFNTNIKFTRNLKLKMKKTML